MSAAEMGGDVARFYAVVPAAGHSRRLGRPKLLLEFGDRVLIERVARAWQEGGVDRVVVTVRRDDRELAERCRQLGVCVVQPSTDPADMKASVVEALRFIAEEYRPRSKDAWLLAPADLPGLTGGHVARVVAMHDAEQPRIVVPDYRGRRGHPVLFPWPLAAEVERLGADEGINSLIAGPMVREISFPDAVVLDDLDTPEDWRMWQAREMKREEEG